MVLVYEFWRYDIPTEIARGLLEEFRIPYEEKISKRRRDSLYDQPCDEWSKIYVDESDLLISSNRINGILSINKYDTELLVSITV